jgi:rubrerythrin
MAKLEIPNFPALLMEPLISVPEPSRVGFIAQLERSAADRYREWAGESEELAEGLIACADREDEIANRAEKLMPVLPEHEEIVAEALAKARVLYASAFEGHSLEDRITLQAHAERQGSLAWLGFASQATDESVKKVFLALADMEVASAEYIDGALGIQSTSEI